MLLILVLSRWMYDNLFGGQKFQCCIDSTAAVWNVRQCQSHFNTAECACKHQLIEVADMADSEDRAL